MPLSDLSAFGYRCMPFSIINGITCNGKGYDKAKYQVSTDELMRKG
jgi:hypothetical protein